MRAYQRGLKIKEDFAPLHYDLGIAATKTGKLELALVHFKRNVELRPGHPAGQFALARVWEELGYRSPAIFALMRFLTLEENTPKSKEAAQRVLALLNRGVSATDDKHVNISIDPTPKMGEGDFGAFQMGLVASAASLATQEKAALPESERFAVVIETAIALYRELADAKMKKTFAFRNYGGFLAEMMQKGHCAAFANIALAQLQTRDAAAWVKDHAAEIAAYHEWVESKGKERPALEM